MPQAPTPFAHDMARGMRRVSRRCHAGVTPGRKCNITLFARASQTIAGRTRISTDNALASHTQHHGIGGIPPSPRKTTERSRGRKCISAYSAFASHKARSAARPAAGQRPQPCRFAQHASNVSTRGLPHTAIGGILISLRDPIRHPSPTPCRPSRRARPHRDVPATNCCSGPSGLSRKYLSGTAPLMGCCLQIAEILVRQPTSQQATRRARP